MGIAVDPLGLVARVRIHFGSNTFLLTHASHCGTCFSTGAVPIRQVAVGNLIVDNRFTGQVDEQ